MDYIDTHKDVTLSVVDKDNRMNKFTECVKEDYPDTDKSILDYYARHLEELYELLDTQDTIRECFKMAGMSEDGKPIIKWSDRI
jgi:hypothetical protein